MPPSRILDSHIHLWPATATTAKDHGWMTDPSHFLAKSHGIADYKDVAQSSPAGTGLQGFIYVETDRYLPSKTPDTSSIAGEEELKKALEVWAKAPLEELKFLRRVVEERPQKGDGFEQGDGTLMKGAVIWAPFHLSSSLFQAYLSIVEEITGPKLWEEIVGFRYLLQGKEEGEVRKLVSSENWIENIASLSRGRRGKGWAFDVGVDIHRDGTDPVGAVGEMIQKVREREARGEVGNQPVRFVLNHLCKHPITTTTATQPMREWLDVVSKLSPDRNVFMKLSGALNEFDSATPSSASEIAKSLGPIVSKVVEAFPERTVFGSDWPVCNVGGPAGEKGNWGLWAETVELLLKESNISESDRDLVWWGAGSRAYGVEM